MSDHVFQQQLKFIHVLCYDPDLRRLHSDKRASEVWAEVLEEGAESPPPESGDAAV